MIRSLILKLSMLVGTLAFLLALNWVGQHRSVDTQHLAERHSLLPTQAMASTPGKKVETSFPNDPSIHAIDVNLSTAQELEGLPGIGPVLAQRIVDHRISVGAFQSLNELDHVKGIGPKKLQKISPLLKISSQVVAAKHQD